VTSVTATGQLSGGCMTTNVAVEELTTAVTKDAPATEVVEQELLVEDVSIDGMCGVY
jgi:mycofactocin precursor